MDIQRLHSGKWFIVRKRGRAIINGQRGHNHLIDDPWIPNSRN